MISIRKDGLIEFKHMSIDELIAFVYFLRHEKKRHQQDIDKINESIKLIESKIKRINKD